MKTSKIVLSIFILLLLWANFSSAKDEEKNSLEKVKLDVKGMTCSACAASVESALKGVKGVKIADVNYQSGEAVVEFENSKAEPKVLISAVEKAGFKASVFKPEDEGKNTDKIKSRK